MDRGTARLSLILVALTGGSAFLTVARAQPSDAPSPFAPTTLATPIFNTAKPDYSTADQGQRASSTVVAEVDGRTVTLGDIKDAISELPPSVRSIPFENLFPGVLAQLVRQQALVIRAQQQALDEDPAVRRKVRSAGDRVMANELLEYTIRPGITEQALLDRYNKDIANRPGPDEVHLRVIMAPTEEAARSIIAELQGGADFATVAKRSSTDSTAPVGGDLGFLRLDGLNAEVGAVAFSMPPGQFTPYPFRSGAGWFIVKVDERRHGAAPTFAEARERLVQAMLREGVADVITQTLKGITVREYSLNGIERTTEAPK